jgi:hypothetical protein
MLCTFDDIATTHLDSFGAEVTAGDFFSRGNCHQLSLALCETLANSQIVALVDCSPNPESASHSPYLVHAAVITGQWVVDIEGIHDVDQWIERWSDQARQPEFVEYEAGHLPWQYTSPRIRDVANTIAAKICNQLEASLVTPTTPRQGPR